MAPKLANSAMAARWSAGGQVTMGTAGRDRRVRARPGSKKRQPGARDEGSSPEVDFVAEPASSSLARPKSYTRKQDVSPSRKRGRVPLLSRQAQAKRTSLDSILAATPKVLVDLMITIGFLFGKPLVGVCACLAPNWVLEERDFQAMWRCKKCKKTQSATKQNLNLWSAKLPLRSIAGALWLFCSPLHLSPDKCALILNLDHRTVRNLFQQFFEFFIPILDRLQATLTVGALGADVELDEISFRSIGRQEGVVWLRFLAIARRGSSLVWIHRLPYRVCVKGWTGRWWSTQHKGTCGIPFA